MEKERYFLITNEDSVDALNEFLKTLEDKDIEYETDYDTDTRNFGILVIVSF